MKLPPKVPDEIGRVLDSWLNEHGGGVRNISTNTFQFSSFAIGISMACVMVTLIGFIVMAIEFNRQDGDIRDLRAWKDIHQNEINALKNERAK